MNRIPRKKPPVVNSLLTERVANNKEKTMVTTRAKLNNVSKVSGKIVNKLSVNARKQHAVALNLKNKFRIIEKSEKLS